MKNLLKYDLMDKLHHSYQSIVMYGAPSNPNYLDNAVQLRIEDAMKNLWIWDCRG